MATLTGTNLLDSIIDSTGIEPNALIYATLSAKLQQMIDNGTYSKLAASLAISGFSTQINAATEALDLADTIEANVALIQAAADDAAVDAIDFPDYGGVAPITYTLTAGADSTYEGEGNTFTVTASAPVEADTTVTFQLVEGTAGLDDFNAGSFNPLTATILAGETTASVSYEAITNDGTEVAETYSVTATIDGVSVGSVDATILDGSLGAGQTFTLTTGLDIIPGMNGSNGNTVNSGDDTIIGVIELTDAAPPVAGGATTYNSTDLLDGGDGTDTMRIIVGGGGTTNIVTDYTVPGNFENIEVLTLQSTAIIGAANALVLNTSAVTGLEQVNVTKIADDLKLTVATTTDVDLTFAGPATAAAVTLTGGNDVTATLTKMTGAGLTTLGATTAVTGTVDVTSTGSAIVGGTGAVTMGAITSTGGTTVNITQDANSVSGDAATAAIATDVVTQGAVTVTGTSATTTVNVVQSDQVTANAAVTDVAGAYQTQTVTFSSMTAGQSVTVNGLTFTAAVALTAEQVAQAFANLTSTDYQDDGGPTANGTYSGQNITLAYTTGDANGASVTYTAATKAANTAALTVASVGATAPTVAAGTNGAAATPGEIGLAGVANGAVVIDDGGTASITSIMVDGYSAGATLGGGGSLDALTDLSLSNSGAGAATLTSTGTSLNLTLDDVDGTVTLPASVTTLTVDTEGTASTGAIVAAGATSVTINADANYTAGAATNLAGATMVDINGSAAVNLANNGFANDTTLQTVNAADNSGGMTVTLGTGNRVAVTGSTGNDVVTLAQTTIAAGDNIALGEGDDTLTFTGAITAGGIAAGVTLSGGNGTDTIGFTSVDAAAVTANGTFETFVDSFEKLAIATTLAAATDSVNLANMDDISYVISGNVIATGALTVTNMADGGTLELNTVGVGVGVTMTDSSGAADTFNVVLDDSLTAAGFNAGTVSVANDAAATNQSGVETLNISVDDTFQDVTGALDAYGNAIGDGKDDTNAAFTLTVTDLAATTNSFATVNVSGDGDLNLTTATNVATSNLATVNASSLNGVLTYTASIADLTVTGGSGADVLSVAATADGADISGGAGKDTFNIAATADLLTLDGGADADTFVFAGASSNKSNYVVIENIGSGDTLDLSALGLTTFNATQITLAQGATESTQAYLDQAMVTLAANGAGWFQMGGNTFIAGDAGADSLLNFADGTDFVVMLTGLVDLSTASFNTTVSTLEIS